MAKLTFTQWSGAVTSTVPADEEIPGFETNICASFACFMVNVCQRIYINHMYQFSVSYIIWYQYKEQQLSQKQWKVTYWNFYEDI